MIEAEEGRVFKPLGKRIARPRSYALLGIPVHLYLQNRVKQKTCLVVTT